MLRQYNQTSLLLLFITIGTFSFLSSCQSKSKPKAEESTEAAGSVDDQGSLLDAVDVSDDRFSDWMSRAELQLMLESLPEGTYFSEVEGRQTKGLNEYRAVTDRFNADLYQEWAVFWGLSEKEQFDYELRFLRLGFKKDHAQVFVDSSSRAVHQLVMLSPKKVNQLAQTHPAAASTVHSEGGSTSSTPVIDESTVEVAVSEVSETSDSGPAVEEPSQESEAALEAVLKKSEAIVKTVAATDSGETEPSTPKPTEEESTAKEEPKPVATAEEVKKAQTHKVASGEYLSKIARKYDVSVADLKKANQLKSDVIHRNQLLVIPK